PQISQLLDDVRPIGAIALPAVLTNVATPVAFGYITAALSAFGEEAVAANAIANRLAPVAFCIVFALSGAIGPIFSQNLGAGLGARVRRTLTDGLLFSVGCVVAAWIVLFVARDGIVAMFAAQGETARLVVFFCTVLAGSWIFHGALFVANAAFNNLGFPLLATGFNWGKATLGTVPFVAAGAHLGGAEGALLGQAVGAVVFGVAGVIVAYRCVDRLSGDPAAMAQAGGTT
ncbi:MAG: MATE family efflux transporter, partial [Sandarakinorhabdus sp.]